MFRGSTSPIARSRDRPSGTLVHRHQEALFLRTEERTEDRGRRGRDSMAIRSAGVPVELQLTQVQWKSVRRAEGNGFYTWDTERQGNPGRQAGRSDNGGTTGAAQHLLRIRRLLLSSTRNRQRRGRSRLP